MIGLPVPKKWLQVPLCAIAEIERTSVSPERIESGTRYVGLEDLDGNGSILAVHEVVNGELASNKFVFGPQHILYGKLRPYLRKIVRPDFAGICSTDILPIRPTGIDHGYLFHYLRQPRLIEYAAGRCEGANLPRLNPAELENFPIIFPAEPIEQRRIADILDKANGLWRKRRQALDEVSKLRRACFVQLFGDPGTIRAIGRNCRFESLCNGDLRNGISPSRDGIAHGKVLVLSAITGNQFDESSVKEASFAEPFGADQVVRATEFLICRGNGNLNLVGSGRFPSRSLLDTAFPDTIIAARIDTRSIEPAFLEEVWSTSYVRKQLEAGARTTNGTYKINQQVLAKITFPVPDIDLQRPFARLAHQIDVLRGRLRDVETTNLFGSLLQRAFQGKL